MLKLETKADLERLIVEQVEESLTLEIKNRRSGVGPERDNGHRRNSRRTQV